MPSQIARPNPRIHARLCLPQDVRQPRRRGRLQREGSQVDRRLVVRIPNHRQPHPLLCHPTRLFPSAIAKTGKKLQNTLFK